LALHLKHIQAFATFSSLSHQFDVTVQGAQLDDLSGGGGGKVHSGANSDAPHFPVVFFTNTLWQLGSKQKDYVTDNNVNFNPKFPVDTSPGAARNDGTAPPFVHMRKSHVRDTMFFDNVDTFVYVLEGDTQRRKLSPFSLPFNHS
jgi:hypothetical protein